MKTVRFHVSVNGGIGRNKAPLPAKSKGKRKGKKMAQNLNGAYGEIPLVGIGLIHLLIVFS